MSNLDGYLIDEATAGVKMPGGIEDAGKVVVVDAEGDNFIFLPPEEVFEGGGGSSPSPVVVTHSSATALTRTSYPDLGAALGANYPSSFPSTAFYDIQPNAHAQAEGSFALDTIVTYVFRSAAGRGAVLLPEMILQSSVYVEGCVILQPVSGGGLHLRDAQVTGPSSPNALDALDSTIGANVNVFTYAKLDRCDIGDNVIITVGADSDAFVTLANCTFGSSPSVVFSGASPGVARMDARSNYLFDAAGGSVTNGFIVVEALI